MSWHHQQEDDQSDIVRRLSRTAAISRHPLPTQVQQAPFPLAEVMMDDLASGTKEETGWDGARKLDEEIARTLASRTEWDGGRGGRGERRAFAEDGRGRGAWQEQDQPGAGDCA
jgi:hypothetical protein